MHQVSKILRRWSSARSVGEPQDVAEIDAIIDIEPEDAQIFCRLASRVITPPRQMGKKFVVSGDELSTLYVELALNPLSRSTILGDQKSGIFKAFMQVKKEAARIARSKKNDLSCERFKTHSNYCARVVACCASLRTIVPECAHLVNTSIDHWNDIARQGMQVVHPDGTGHAATSNYIRRGAPFFLQLLELMCSTIDRAFSTESDRAASKARICLTWINSSYLSTFNWGNNKYRELLPSSKWQHKSTDFRAFHDRICEVLNAIRDLDTLYDEVSAIAKDNPNQLWRFTENAEAWQYWKDEIREYNKKPEAIMEVDSSSDEEMAPPSSPLCLTQFQQPPLPSYTPGYFDFRSSSNEFIADDDERVPPSAHLALWNTDGVIDQGGYAVAPFIPAPGGNSTSSNSSHQSIGLISICSNIPPFQIPETGNNGVRDSVEATKEECSLYVNSGIEIADDCDYESDFGFDDGHSRSAHSYSAPQVYQPQMYPPQVYQPQMFVPEMVYQPEAIPCHRRRSLSFERRVECPISYCNEQDLTLTHLLENHLDVIGGRLSSWDEEWIQMYVVKLFHDAVTNHEEISRPLLEATRQQFEYFVPPDIVQLKQEILACIDALERRCA